MKLTQAQIEAFTSSALQWALPALLKLVGVLLAFWIASKIAAAMGSAVSKGLEKAKFDETLSKFGAKLTRYLILIMAGLGCLGAFGIETTSFAAVLGAAGFAVGLAFQGTLANFSSGVMLLIFRPFKVGDVVKVAGQTGKIDEIELFTTTLDTPDKRRIIIPNSAIFGSTIENISFHPVRRFNVDVGADYSADLDATRKALEAAAASVKTIESDPAPAVVLTGLGGSSVDWTVRGWATGENFWGAKEALTRAIKIEMDKAGIGIPYATYDVNLTGITSEGALKLVQRQKG
jgi:small conductance mechanosensitive channel